MSQGGKEGERKKTHTQSTLTNAADRADNQNDQLLDKREPVTTALLPKLVPHGREGKQLITEKKRKKKPLPLYLMLDEKFDATRAR